MNSIFDDFLSISTYLNSNTNLSKLIEYLLNEDNNFFIEKEKEDLKPFLFGKMILKTTSFYRLTYNFYEPIKLRNFKFIFTKTKDGTAEFNSCLLEVRLNGEVKRFRLNKERIQSINLIRIEDNLSLLNFNTFV